ncbi:MAG: hypothetical protein ABSB40_11810 [Nitrososphaeria archaeon]|jgi:hypothetical protein
MKGRKARKGQFLILTAVVLVLALILISTILNTAILSRTEYLEPSFREVTQKISTDFPDALGGALSNATMTYKATGNMTEALLNAEISLANWRENILNEYVGFGVRLSVSDPVIELNWDTPDEGNSSITANVGLNLTTLGFSGWNDTETVEASAQVQRSPDSVIVTPNELTFNMTFVKEDGSPVTSLTNETLEINAHYVGAQQVYQTLNMSTATFRYLGNGLYNITAGIDNTIDAFQLAAYDDRGVLVCLTSSLAVPVNEAIVKSIKLTTGPSSTKADVTVVSSLNKPIQGATVYGHWAGPNVTSTDQVPEIMQTNANGIAEFTASTSSLFKQNVTKGVTENSNVGVISFNIDDVLFVPVIGVIGPATANNINGWTGVNNAKIDNEQPIVLCASASTSGSQATFSGYNFNMIPSNMTITNVWLRLDSWTPGTLDNNYISVAISNDSGTKFPWSVNVYPPTYPATPEPTPLGNYPLWIKLNSTSPLGWNVTQLQNTNFYFKLTKITVGSSATVYLDFIPIVVLYQPNYVYEPLRSVTQATAVKRGASLFVGTWSNAANALQNNTNSYAYATTASSTLILRPNAAGTYQQWATFGSGSSHFGSTSDQSDLTGVQITGNTSAKETENLQNSTQTATINNVTIYMRAKESGTTLVYNNVTFDAASSATTSAIAFSTGTTDYGTGTGETASAITINAGDFVLADVAIVGTSVTVSSITLGYGNSMSSLTSNTGDGIGNYLYYYVATTSLGSVTPRLRLSSLGAYHAWTVVDYTGVSTSSPYWANTGTSGGTSISSGSTESAATMAAKSTGRLVVSAFTGISASNSATAITIAAANSENQREVVKQSGSSSNQAVSAELEDYASDASRINKATYTDSGVTMDYNTITVTLLPARSMSWTHTVGTGSNRLLLVSIGTYNISGTPATVSSIKYGGVALTLVASDVYSTNPQVGSYLYSLTNPASGSNTINVTFSASTLAVGGSVSYFNVNQTNPIQSTGINQNSGTTQSVTVTPTGTYSKIFYASMMSYQTASYTVTGSGQTNRWTQTSSNLKGRESEKNVTGGTSQTMSWTTSSTVSWVAIGAIIVPTNTNPVEQAVILWRTHSTNYQSSAFTISRTAFTNYSKTLTINNNTGQPWTWAEVNALEIGAMATQLGATETIQVSEFWIVVNYMSAPTERYYGFGFNIPSESIIDYVDIQSDLWLQSSGNDYVNMSISRNSGVSWLPAQPFQVNPLTINEKTYHTNATGWYKWTPADLNGNGIQVNITKVTVGASEQVNLDYLALYVVYHNMPTLSPPFMHVDNITLSQQGTSPKKLQASVKIVDARLDPVLNAKVYVTITDTNGSSWVRNANTASNGIVTFSLPGIQSGHSYTLTVTNVIMTDWVYDIQINYVSSESYKVT